MESDQNSFRHSTLSSSPASSVTAAFAAIFVTRPIQFSAKSRTVTRNLARAAPFPKQRGHRKATKVAWPTFLRIERVRHVAVLHLDHYMFKCDFLRSQSREALQVIRLQRIQQRAHAQANWQLYPEHFPTPVNLHPQTIVSQTKLLRSSLCHFHSLSENITSASELTHSRAQPVLAIEVKLRIPNRKVGCMVHKASIQF